SSSSNFVDVPVTVLLPAVSAMDPVVLLLANAAALGQTATLSELPSSPGYLAMNGPLLGEPSAKSDSYCARFLTSRPNVLTVWVFAFAAGADVTVKAVEFTTLLTVYASSPIRMRWPACNRTLSVPKPVENAFVVPTTVVEPSVSSTVPGRDLVPAVALRAPAAIARTTRRRLAYARNDCAENQCEAIVSSGLPNVRTKASSESMFRSSSAGPH